QVMVEEAIQQDPKSDAHVLQAGSLPPSPPDLIDSMPMQKLLNMLSKKYDFVIIDSAPVQAVSDTLFLSRLADKTVLTVKWAETRREVAQMALRRLQDAKADVAGVLLSMVDVKGHAKYGYSDSGAYHGKLKKYYTG
ncbi:MAG: CpsD/CapB family tyrosine-protein kinase, partial [Pseudomonadota bacterium]